MGKPNKLLTTAADTFNLNTYVDPSTGLNPFNTGSGWWGSVDGATGNDTFVADFGTTTENINMTASGAGRTFSSGASVAVTAVNFEKFNITSGAGNDTLVGSGGNDVLKGGNGNDTFRIGAVVGIDSYDGGGGLDYLIASWATASDNLALTATGGTVAGTAIANFERYNVTTGIGDDNVATNLTYRYADIVVTGAGNDTVTMGAGNDKADGGEGVDTLILNLSTSSAGMKYSTAAASGYTGGYVGGNTTIAFKNFEKFDITGTAYSDHIVTGAGNDVINAGNGNDKINSGSGVDSIDGGANLDQWSFDFATESAALTINANMATATAIAPGLTTYMNVEVLTGVTGTGNDIVQTKDNVGLNDSISLGAGNDQVISIGANPGNDTYDGGTGVDTLILNQGAAVVDLTASIIGTTFTSTSAGSGTVTAINFEKYSLTTGNGFDEINGGVNNDIISAGAGNDTINGGGGSDTIDGGSGTDSFIMNVGATTQAVSLSMASVATRTSTGNYSIGGTAATGSISNMEIINITTGAGNDVLIDTSYASNVFSTGVGNDIVNVGSGGMDVVDGGTGTDKLVIDWTVSSTALFLNTNPEDVVSGSTVYGDPNAADSVVYKNFEVFELHGGSSNDSLVGGALSDFLEGNAGADVLNGGASDDTLRGDRADGTAYGKDIFVATAGGGTDTVLDAGAGAIADYISAAGIEFSGLSNGNGSTVGMGQIQVAISAASTFVYVGLDGNQGADHTFKLEGDYTAAGRFSLEAGALKINGVGTQTPGTLVGTEAKDTLTGTSASETMDGKGGNDVINGGAGNDILIGRDGIDSLTGGAGTDTFRFYAATDSAAGAYDTITDFVSGTDKIHLASIDPNPVKSGDQPFVFSTDAFFSGVRGELIYTPTSNMLLGDMDADGVADFQIYLSGVASITAADFVL